VGDLGNLLADDGMIISFGSADAALLHRATGGYKPGGDQFIKCQESTSQRQRIVIQQVLRALSADI